MPDSRGAVKSEPPGIPAKRIGRLYDPTQRARPCWKDWQGPPGKASLPMSPRKRKMYCLMVERAVPALGLVPGDAVIVKEGPPDKIIIHHCVDLRVLPVTLRNLQAALFEGRIVYQPGQVEALYLQSNPGSNAQDVRDALFINTTRGKVTSSRTVNNHLLFTDY